MATNTMSKTLGKLTIKYSPDYPISEFQAYGLYCSLLLACEYLKKSITLLTPICNGWKESNDLASKTLKYHFFNNCDVRQAEYRRRDVIQISNGLRQILSGLSVDVTIKDSYATAIGKAVRKFDKENDDRSLLADMGIGQARSIAEYTRDMNLIRSLAAAEAEDVRGFVQPKKTTARALHEDRLTSSYISGELTRPVGLERLAANDPRRPKWMNPMKAPDPKLVVQLAPELLGSIHINLKRMLRTEDPLSNSIVATTIIHEASHKFISTHDFAYTGELLYESLDRRQTLNNADSYAFASVSLGRNRLLKNDFDQKMLDAGFL